TSITPLSLHDALPIFPQLDRVLTRVAQHGGGADRRLHDQLRGQGARQAEQDAGVDHRLDEVEEVRRPGTGQRGYRVQLRFRYPRSEEHTSELQSRFDI